MLFAETWYPLFALNQALGWLMPIVALLSGQPWMRVGYLQFVALHCLSTASCLLLVSWLRRRGMLRPQSARFLTWRSALLTAARWPFVLLAVTEAVAGRVLRRDFPFRVTPKGRRDRKSLPLRIVAPYAVLVTGSLLAVFGYIRRDGRGASDGYLYLALVGACVNLAVVAAVVLLNQRENVRTWRVPRTAAWRMHAPGWAVTAGLVAMLVTAGAAALPRAADAAFWQSAGPVRSAVQDAVLALGVSDRCGGGDATALELAARGETGAASATAPASGCPIVAPPLDRPFLGIYDPAGAMTGPADAEQVFVQWKPMVGEEVRAHLARILAQRRVPIVTVEPYPWVSEGLGAETLLTDISSGGYDVAIRGIAGAVAAVAPTPVYLRFAHEMDLTGAYPWSQRDYPAFIAAFRHFALAVRAAAGNARIIWSPAGVTADSASYYPGDDAVDGVGVTGLVAEEWTGAGNAQSFTDMMNGRQRLATRFGKPLIVCELGASIDDEAERLRWIREVRAAMGDYPLLLGVVYFDDRLSFADPAPDVPDWRLTPAELAVLFAPPAGDVR